MTDPIKVLIVDDEAPARAIVRELLADHPHFIVAAECANGYEAVKAVAEHQPDLMFLDIQMPKLDGFEVLDLLERKPQVVFVTAYDEYAVRAFQVHAVDYLLKPFSAARFAEVLAHVESVFQRGAGGGANAGVAAAVASVRKPLQRIAFREGGTIDVVPVQRIDYLEAQDDYVHVYARGQKHVKQQTLAELEAMLDSTRFLRVHRSYVINLESLARVEPYAKDSRVAVLKDGTRIPISRAGYERLKEVL